MSFNLRETRAADVDPLYLELLAFDVHPIARGFKITIGDENIHAESIDECFKLINEGVDELKTQQWDLWKRLGNTGEELLSRKTKAESELDNLLFLNRVKKSYLLASIFEEDLSPIPIILSHLLDSDIEQMNTSLISKFNELYIKICCLHHLILREIYRAKLLKRYEIDRGITKTSQIAGPWANLDLPMKERVWSWDEDEEYFAERQKTRRNQTRYNPEYNKFGYYYVWQDLSGHPYSFWNARNDSPYKSSFFMSIG